MSTSVAILARRINSRHRRGISRQGVKPTSATTRVRGLAPWQPQHVTLKLLETVKSVLIEYAKYLPLTVRQVFYRLVGAHGYDKTERNYKRLGY